MFEKLVEWCPNAATSQDITVPTLLSVLSFASLVQFEGSVSSIPTFFQDRLQKIPRQTPPNPAKHAIIKQVSGESRP
jgi:hypothetical protein